MKNTQILLIERMITDICIYVGDLHTQVRIYVCTRVHAHAHTHIQWDFLPPQLFTQRKNKILPATIKFTFYNGRDHKGTTVGPDF